MKKKELIATWVEIGKRNHWISQATDPVFGEHSFCQCNAIDELMDRFEHGNWCLGQAFFYKNVCFINQINAGDEWRTIRGDVAFESVSCGRIIKEHGREEFRIFMDLIMDATDEQLSSWKYDHRLASYDLEPCQVSLVKDGSVVIEFEKPVYHKEMSFKSLKWEKKGGGYKLHLVAVSGELVEPKPHIDISSQDNALYLLRSKVGNEAIIA